MLAHLTLKARICCHKNTLSSRPASGTLSSSASLSHSLRPVKHGFARSNHARSACATVFITTYPRLLKSEPLSLERHYGAKGTIN